MKIDAAEMYELIEDWYGDDSDRDFKFKVKKKILTDSDDEDGGGWYDIIFEEIATGDLYKGSYTDWDIDNTDYDEETGEIYEDGRVDLCTTLTKVKAVKTTTTKYV